MRFLSALLAPRAKSAPQRPLASQPNPPAPPGAPIDREDTPSYLDSVLTQIAAANEELAHSRFGGDAAFAETQPAAMEPQPEPAPQRRTAPDACALEGLDVREVDDADLLQRLFSK